MDPSNVRAKNSPTHLGASASQLASRNLTHPHRRRFRRGTKSRALDAKGNTYHIPDVPEFLPASVECRSQKSPGVRTQECWFLVKWPVVATCLVLHLYMQLQVNNIGSRRVITRAQQCGLATAAAWQEPLLQPGTSRSLCHSGEQQEQRLGGVRLVSRNAGRPIAARYGVPSCREEEKRKGHEVRRTDADATPVGQWESSSRPRSRGELQPGSIYGSPARASASDRNIVFAAAS